MTNPTTRSDQNNELPFCRGCRARCVEPLRDGLCDECWKLYPTLREETRDRISDEPFRPWLVREIDRIHQLMLDAKAQTKRSRYADAALNLQAVLAQFDARSRAAEAQRPTLTCATCKHWTEQADQGGNRNVVGLCRRILSPTRVETFFDFGCTLHESLPAPPDGGRDQ